MNKRIISLSLFLAVVSGVAFACTSAIISGSASKSGRPLLWKHRDAGVEDNFVAKIEAKSAEGFDYVALFNAEDSTYRDAWLGMNEVGFAIMNTASYNLAPDTTDYKDREGIVMALALSKCRTLDDFENLLDTLPKPMGVQANFGLIDASGDGAYYETDDYSYVKYSLKDTKDGILIRTNYSHNRNVDGGYGYIREENARQLLAPYVAGDSISAETFTEGLSCSFFHSLIGRDFSNGGDRWVIDQDFIPRRSSTASVVIEGVRPGENSSLSIMWTKIGYPPCSHVVPVMVEDIPRELQPDPLTWHSPLCDFVVEQKHKVFSIKRGSGNNYIDMDLLKKIMQQESKISQENYKKGYLKREEKAKSLKK
ncbi:MAG: hypothetical protein IJN66_09185 [Muribaculaceae bacterium]|nr:hypothetical protein [Muribaculaceae bacterium]